MAVPCEPRVTGDALMAVTRPAVFLDRDGVLTHLVSESNGSSRPPWDASEFRIFPEAQDMVRDLSQAGFEIFVVTNQPDVGKGLVSCESVDELNRMLRVRIPEIKQVRTCFHTSSDHCQCRKPKPGMLRELAVKFQIDLSRSWMVGDRWVDIAAGASAGCRTLLIEHSYSWSDTSAGSPPIGLQATHMVGSLSEVVPLVLGSDRPRQTYERPPEGR